MLRRLKEKDADRMLQWMQDPEVNKKFRVDFSMLTKGEVENFIKNSFTDQNQHFAIIDEEDVYQGTISLKNISKQDLNAEYAIVLMSQSQGRGLAWQATQEILKYSFQELGLKKVYLNVLKENEHARQFYEKIGFVREGIFRQHWNIKGEFHDLYWYAVYK